MKSSSPMHEMRRQAAALLLSAALLCAQPFRQEAAGGNKGRAGTPSDSRGFVKPDPKEGQKEGALGSKAEAAGRLAEALGYYDEAARHAPGEVTVVSRGATLRSRLVREHMEAAE